MTSLTRSKNMNPQNPDAGQANICNNVYIRSHSQSFKEIEFNLWYIHTPARLCVTEDRLVSRVYERLNLKVLGPKVSTLHTFFWPDELT